MSGWTDPDVTPVGGVPERRVEAERPLPSAPLEDPFGQRPTTSRRGWVRVVLGGLLLVAGVIAVGAGIVQAVGTHGAIVDDAVVRGTVRAAPPAEPDVFTVPAGERRRYSVYLLFDGVTSNEEVRDLAVRDTGCTATMPDGVETTFRGARQTVAATIGGAASVGTFSSLPGRVKVACAYVSGTRRSERTRPDAVGFVVTPGSPSFATSGVLTIVGGVTGALLGGFLLLSGWRRRVVVG